MATRNKEMARSLVEHIFDEDNQTDDLFNQLVSEKAMDILEHRKQEIAKDLLGEGLVGRALKTAGKAIKRAGVVRKIAVAGEVAGHISTIATGVITGYQLGAMAHHAFKNRQKRIKAQKAAAAKKVQVRKAKKTNLNTTTQPATTPATAQATRTRQAAAAGVS